MLFRSPLLDALRRAGLAEPDRPALNAAGEDAEIYWGAYLGTADQLLASGRIAAVQDEIARVRQAAQERYGWIMDTYLIRRAER